MDEMRIGLPKIKINDLSKDNVSKNIAFFIGFSGLSVGLGLISLALINKYLIIKTQIFSEDSRLI